MLPGQREGLAPPAWASAREGRLPAPSFGSRRETKARASARPSSAATRTTSVERVSAQRSFGKAGTQKAFGPDGETTAAPGQHRRASARTDRPRRAPVEAPPALRRQESGCRPDSLASAEQPGFFSERNPRDAKRSPIFGRVMPSGTVHSEGLALLSSPDQRELDVSPRPFGGADTCQVPAPPALLGGTA